MSINADAGFFQKKTHLFKVHDPEDEFVTEAQLLLEERGYEFINGHYLSILKEDIEAALKEAKEDHTKTLFKKLLDIISKEGEDYIDVIIY